MDQEVFDEPVRPATLDLSQWCLERLSKWSNKRYLRSCNPNALVDVSATEDGYVAGTVDEHESIRMPVARFLAQLSEDEEAERWTRKPSKLHYHLAQCSLTSLPDLHRDAWPPPPCVPASRVTNLAANLWFAIGPNTSSMHYDAYHNVVCACTCTVAWA